VPDARTAHAAPGFLFRSWRPRPFMASAIERSDAPLAFMGEHVPDCGVLVLRLDQSAVLIDVKTEWNSPAEISIAVTLVSLHIGDALTDAVALSLGNRRQDRPGGDLPCRSPCAAAALTSLMTRCPSGERMTRSRLARSRSPARRQRSTGWEMGVPLIRQDH
jgi:hypothetical protein